MRSATSIIMDSVRNQYGIRVLYEAISLTRVNVPYIPSTNGTGSNVTSDNGAGEANHSAPIRLTSNN